MDDPMMDAFLCWGNGELNEFPDFGLDLFDYRLSIPAQSPISSLSPPLPSDYPELSVEDQPRPNLGSLNAAQTAARRLSAAVCDLLSRVAELESQ
jgi:hypothetical protein